MYVNFLFVIWYVSECVYVCGCVRLGSGFDICCWDNVCDKTQWTAANCTRINTFLYILWCLVLFQLGYRLCCCWEVCSLFTLISDCFFFNDFFLCPSWLHYDFASVCYYCLSTTNCRSMKSWYEKDNWCMKCSRIDNYSYSWKLSMATDYGV